MAKAKATTTKASTKQSRKVDMSKIIISNGHQGTKEKSKTMPTADMATTANRGMNVIEIPIEEIVIVPDAHRADDTSAKRDAAIKETADSIRELGLLNPITVRIVDGSYELIAGRIRLAACSLLGKETISASVVNYDDIRAKMAMWTENLVRLNYTQKQYDIATREWKELYESLHPETRANVAGGVGKRGKGAKQQQNGQAVKAAPATPSFAKVLGDKMGVSPRTVQRSAKRGKVFTEDDYKIFEAKAISHTDQDKLAGISDTGKRQEILAQIQAGTSFQKAFDATLGIQSDAVDANTEAGATPDVSDEDWLSECPIRKKVATKLFDAQALSYRRLLSVKNALGKAYRKTSKEFQGLLNSKTGYMAAVNRFLKLKHPKEWLVCGACGGTTTKDGKPCADCAATGFLTD